MKKGERGVATPPRVSDTRSLKESVSTRRVEHAPGSHPSNMRPPVVLLLCCLCLHVRAFLPSLCTRLPQCRSRAAVIKDAAPGGGIPSTWIIDEDDLRQHHRMVWALVFNFRSEVLTESIFVQRMGGLEYGSPDGHECVLTWQSWEDAESYRKVLAIDHGYYGSTTVPVDTFWLLDTICKPANHIMCLLPSSTVEIPADANLEDVEWHQEGLVSGGAMTEENLRRRRNELDRAWTL